MLKDSIRMIFDKNRMALGAFGFFAALMLIFIIVRPSLFLQSDIYSAVFVSLPVFVIMSVSLVFVVVAGEIDLAFPSIIGLSAWVYGLMVRSAYRLALRSCPPLSWEALPASSTAYW